MLVICRTRGTCGRLTAGEGVVLQRGIVHSVWEHGEHGRCTKVNMIQRTPCFCRRSLKSTYTSLVAQDGKADGRKPASCPAMWSSPRVGQEATQRLQTPAVGHRVCRPAYTRAKKSQGRRSRPAGCPGRLSQVCPRQGGDSIGPIRPRMSNYPHAMRRGPASSVQARGIA